MHIRLPGRAAVAFLMRVIVGVQAAGTSTAVRRALVFLKASVSLAKGDRITFTNEDDVIHNIHIFGPGDDQKDLGLQKPVRRSATSSTRPAPTWSAATSIHR